MGVIYTVLPLDRPVAEYLRERDVAVPADPRPSRNPTPREVRDAVLDLPGIAATLDEGPNGALSRVTLTTEADPAEWTILHVSRHQGEHAPCEIWFEKGSVALIVRALAGLGRRVGPLVLIPDTGDPPLVVAPDQGLAG